MSYLNKDFEIMNHIIIRNCPLVCAYYNHDEKSWVKFKPLNHPLNHTPKSETSIFFISLTVWIHDIPIFEANGISNYISCKCVINILNQRGWMI